MNATLLQLADGRFPAGGHAHSGGIEAAVESARVTDIASLAAFLVGRLHTAGLVGAALAAVAAAATEWAELDAEADARTPSPEQRRASRSQGAGLLRAARIVWPSPRLDALSPAPHQPIALGAAAWSAGLGPRDAALAYAHGSVSGPAWASVRLLGLDPMAVAHVLAELSTEVDAIGSRAAACVGAPLWDLPCTSAPRLDVDAELHATWEVRLFAS
jgi:urease accessory protein